MTSALKEELKKWLNQLATDERKDPTRYHDSGMLFRLPNGLAVEPVLIRKKFLKWQDAHPEFPRIVFHGLRHSSATYQLMISLSAPMCVPSNTVPSSKIKNAFILSSHSAAFCDVCISSVFLYCLIDLLYHKKNCVAIDPVCIKTHKKPLRNPDTPWRI